MPEPERSLYQYAVLRVVPRVERGECFNAGVILICRPRRFLGARVALDLACLAALAPNLSPANVQSHLDAVLLIAAGDPAGGPVARITPAERFHWLTAPSSTILQPGPVHSGLCHDPSEQLAHLFNTLVSRVPNPMRASQPGGHADSAQSGDARYDGSFPQPGEGH